MTELRKIYLVTTGTYSGYGIRAAFASLERAKRFIADAGNALEAPQVEVFTVDEPGRWVSIAKLTMFRDGNTIGGPWISRVWQDELAASADDVEPTVSLVQWRWTSPDYAMTITVQTDSHEHAVKVANEHRIRLIESGQWPENSRRAEMAVRVENRTLIADNAELRAQAACDAVMIEQLQVELDELRG